MRNRKKPFELLLSVMFGTIAIPGLAAGTIECQKDSPVTYREGKTYPVLAKGFCWEKETRYLASYDCHENRKCAALKMRDLPTRYRAMVTAIGSPSFKRCKLVGGEPFFAYLPLGKKPAIEPVCQFYDKSFVGLSYLDSVLIRYKD